MLSAGWHLGGGPGAHLGAACARCRGSRLAQGRTAGGPRAALLPCAQAPGGRPAGPAAGMHTQQPRADAADPPLAPVRGQPRCQGSHRGRDNKGVHAARAGCAHCGGKDRSADDSEGSTQPSCRLHSEAKKQARLAGLSSRAEAIKNSGEALRSTCRMLAPAIADALRTNKQGTSMREWSQQHPAATSRAVLAACSSVVRSLERKPREAHAVPVSAEPTGQPAHWPLGDRKKPGAQSAAGAAAAPRVCPQRRGCRHGTCAGGCPLGALAAAAAAHRTSCAGRPGGGDTPARRTSGR